MWAMGRELGSWTTLWYKLASAGKSCLHRKTHCSAKYITKLALSWAHIPYTPHNISMRCAIVINSDMHYVMWWLLPMFSMSMYMHNAVNRRGQTNGKILSICDLCLAFEAMNIVDLLTILTDWRHLLLVMMLRFATFLWTTTKDGQTDYSTPCIVVNRLKYTHHQKVSKGN